eukprot:1121700-Pleurochrysis_carterae.AAC.1
MVAVVSPSHDTSVSHRSHKTHPNWAFFLALAKDGSTAGRTKKRGVAAYNARRHQRTMAAAAAVCITGQLRTFVAANLHTQLRTTVLDVLPADAFLSVDAADTSYDVQSLPSRSEFSQSAARALTMS